MRRVCIYSFILSRAAEKLRAADRAPLFPGMYLTCDLQLAKFRDFFSTFLAETFFDRRFFNAFIRFATTGLERTAFRSCARFACRITSRAVVSFRLRADRLRGDRWVVGMDGECVVLFVTVCEKNSI